jgi:hypothetical protein
MILKKLITAIGVAGTLGGAAPAFADWYRPVPAPIVVPPAPVVVTPPAYGYGYDYGYRYEGRPDYRWRRERAWRHWEHERREHERREHRGWHHW